MRIYKFLTSTKAEGPGVRACIWVQGCSHGCKGCFATHLWDYKGGYEISVDEIIGELSKIIHEIDGITFLGGEPFDKAGELADIARYMKSQGKSVISFSGYLYEELKCKPECNELLKLTDLLCDGPFVKELTDYSRPLLGSSNQRFIYLTDAISSDEMDKYKNRFEIRVNKNGHAEINGMGDIEKIRSIVEKEIGSENEITNI